jgi:hypothetical protein
MTVKKFAFENFDYENVINKESLQYRDKETLMNIPEFFKNSLLIPQDEEKPDDYRELENNYEQSGKHSPEVEDEADEQIVEDNRMIFTPEELSKKINEEIEKAKEEWKKNQQWQAEFELKKTENLAEILRNDINQLINAIENDKKKNISIFKEIINAIILKLEKRTIENDEFWKKLLSEIFALIHDIAQVKIEINSVMNEKISQIIDKLNYSNLDIVIVINDKLDNNDLKLYYEDILITSLHKDRVKEVVNIVTNFFE